MTTLDIRQSDNWTEYLNMYGWQQFKLSNNSVIRFKKTPFGLLAKLQRPSFLNEEALNELDTLCMSNHVLVLKLEPSVGQDLSLVADHKFVKTGDPHLATKTLTIDLTKPTETLWAELSKNAKRSIKRATAAGIAISEALNLESDYLALHTLLESTGKRKSFYVQTLSEIKKKSQAFKKESYIFNAYDENSNLCSSQLYLGFRDTAWSFHGTTSERGLHNNAGYKLLWEACLLLKQKGYKTIDLEGIEDIRYPKFTRTWSGFSDYKLKFGGDVVTFPETYTKFFSKPFAILAGLGIVM